jgi:hypothetical protein
MVIGAPIGFSDTFERHPVNNRDISATRVTKNPTGVWDRRACCFAEERMAGRFRAEAARMTDSYGNERFTEDETAMPKWLTIRIIEIEVG